MFRLEMRDEIIRQTVQIHRRGRQPPVLRASDAEPPRR
jgi:hypothetical protein